MSEKKVSIACCILTHDHPDTINDIMDRTVSLYITKGIDIYVYDDSTNDVTREIVEEYIEQGMDQLYYVDTHMVHSGNEKMLYVLKGYGLAKSYDYIWPVKDRVCFSEEYIDRLIEALNHKPDVVLGMGNWQRWNANRTYSKREYYDPAEFYRDYGFCVTNWEMMCFNVKSIVEQTDWEKYEEIYHVTADNPFNRYVWIFNRLAENDRCYIEVCPYEFTSMYVSPYSTSEWLASIFSLWIDKWISANESLPDIYNLHKMETIKAQTNLSDVFGSAEQMMSYHEKGIYTLEIYEKYEKIWSFITEIPIEWLKLIAIGDYETIIRLIKSSFEQAIRRKEYNRAQWLFFSNSWFSKAYEEKKHNALYFGLYNYRDQMMQHGYTTVFDGCDSMEDIIKKYGDIK